MHRGVYAVGHPGLTRRGACLAAVFAGGPGALLSHRSAAWLWGLTARWLAQVEITGPGPRANRRGLRVHCAGALTEDDRASRDGIPTTSVARTLLDFAAIDPGYLNVALERCERYGLLDMIGLDSLLARSDGFRGVARLRQALDIYRQPGLSRSGLERRFLALVRRAGLPRPATNLFIEGYELDVYWETARFAVELDTYDYHGGRAAFERDRLRQEDLKLAGIELVRITNTRLEREPGAIIQRLRRLLAHRNTPTAP
ncbi:MAG: DUF559 domain-containing protein [Solirubrobacterales bacterium]